VHVTGHVIDECPDDAANPGGTLGESRRKFLISAAQQEQLDRQAGPRQALHNVQHHRRSVAAKQNQSRRHVRIQSMALALRGPVGMNRIVETGVNRHAGNAPDMVGRHAYPERLCHGAIGPANKVLILPFDPEVRRMVRDVGQNGNQWCAWKCNADTLVQCAIEMRDDRHHQIGAVYAPEVAQFLHHAGVEQADNAVHGRQHPGRSLGPAAPQAPIVNVLRIDACSLPYKIKVAQNVLQVDQLDFPGSLFNADGFGKRHRSAAVSATRVKEDNLYRRHFET